MCVCVLLMTNLFVGGIGHLPSQALSRSIIWNCRHTRNLLIFYLEVGIRNTIFDPLLDLASNSVLGRLHSSSFLCTNARKARAICRSSKDGQNCERILRGHLSDRNGCMPRLPFASVRSACSARNLTTKKGKAHFHVYTCLRL
jgi:hypothetical protein